MMVLPFVTLVAALAFGIAQRRAAAVAFWVLSLAATLILFRVHATDVLPLSF